MEIPMNDLIIYGICFVITFVCSLLIVKRYKVKFGLIISFIVSIIVFASFSFIIPTFFGITLDNSIQAISTFFGFFGGFIASIDLLNVIKPKAIEFDDTPQYPAIISSNIKKMEESSVDGKYYALENLYNLHLNNPALRNDCIYAVCKAMMNEKNKDYRGLFIRWICCFNKNWDNE